jgi:hypothetical protein
MCKSDYGHLRYAKEFISEASAHADTYGDKVHCFVNVLCFTILSFCQVTQAWCLHLSAKINFIEGEIPKAIQVSEQ